MWADVGGLEALLAEVWVMSAVLNPLASGWLLGTCSRWPSTLSWWLQAPQRLASLQTLALSICFVL